MTSKELFYAELCSICNELKVCGQECLSCKLDSVMDTYNARIINDNKKIGLLTDKVKAQNKLLVSGVVVKSEEYAALIEMKNILKDLVADIETPKRWGLGEVNPNWEALNLTKQKIKEIDDE